MRDFLFYSFIAVITVAGTVWDGMEGRMSWPQARTSILIVVLCYAVCVAYWLWQRQRRVSTDRQ